MNFMKGRTKRKPLRGTTTRDVEVFINRFREISENRGIQIPNQMMKEFNKNIKTKDDSRRFYKLEFKKCKLYDQHVEVLCDVLNEFPIIRKLDLTYNFLTEKSCDYLLRVTQDQVSLLSSRSDLVGTNLCLLHKIHLGGNQKIAMQGNLMCQLKECCRLLHVADVSFDIKTAWTKADKKRKGVLDVGGLVDGYRMLLGHSPAKSTVARILSDYGDPNSRTFTMEAFEAAMQEKMRENRLLPGDQPGDASISVGQVSFYDDSEQGSRLGESYDEESVRLKDINDSPEDLAQGSTDSFPSMELGSVNYGGQSSGKSNPKSIFEPILEEPANPEHIKANSPHYQDPETSSLAGGQEQSTEEYSSHETRHAGPWTEHLDPDSGEMYYYNNETEESQWDKPEEFLELEASLRDSKSASHAEQQETSLQTKTITTDEDQNLDYELSDDSSEVADSPKRQDSSKSETPTLDSNQDLKRESSIEHNDLDANDMDRLGVKKVESFDMDVDTQNGSNEEDNSRIVQVENNIPQDGMEERLSFSEKIKAWQERTQNSNTVNLDRPVSPPRSASERSNVRRDSTASDSPPLHRSNTMNNVEGQRTTRSLSRAGSPQWKSGRNSSRSPSRSPTRVNSLAIENIAEAGLRALEKEDSSYSEASIPQENTVIVIGVRPETPPRSPSPRPMHKGKVKDPKPASNPASPSGKMDSARSSSAPPVQPQTPGAKSRFGFTERKLKLQRSSAEMTPIAMHSLTPSSIKFSKMKSTLIKSVLEKGEATGASTVVDDLKQRFPNTKGFERPEESGVEINVGRAKEIEEVEGLLDHYKCENDILLMSRMALKKAELPEELSYHQLNNVHSLIISYNLIEVLPAATFRTLRSLRILDVSHNVLKKLTPVNEDKMFEDLPASLIEIDASHNSLLEIGGLQVCSKLKKLNLSNNRIRMASGLETLATLQDLDLGHNALKAPISIRNLSFNQKLSVLILEGNPLVKHPRYRASLISIVSHVKHIDKRPMPKPTKTGYKAAAEVMAKQRMEQEREMRQATKRSMSRIRQERSDERRNKEWERMLKDREKRKEEIEKQLEKKSKMLSPTPVKASYQRKSMEKMSAPKYPPRQKIKQRSYQAFGKAYEENGPRPAVPKAKRRLLPSTNTGKLSVKDKLAIARGELLPPPPTQERRKNPNSGEAKAPAAVTLAQDQQDQSRSGPAQVLEAPLENSKSAPSEIKPPTPPRPTTQQNKPFVAASTLIKETRTREWMMDMEETSQTLLQVIQSLVKVCESGSSDKSDRIAALRENVEILGLLTEVEFPSYLSFDTGNAEKIAEVSRQVSLLKNGLQNVFDIAEGKTQQPIQGEGAMSRYVALILREIGPDFLIVQEMEESDGIDSSRAESSSPLIPQEVAPEADGHLNEDAVAHQTQDGMATATHSGTTSRQFSVDGAHSELSEQKDPVGSQLGDFEETEDKHVSFQQGGVLGVRELQSRQEVDTVSVASSAWSLETQRSRRIRDLEQMAQENTVKSSLLMRSLQLQGAVGPPHQIFGHDQRSLVSLEEESGHSENGDENALGESRVVSPSNTELSDRGAVDSGVEEGKGVFGRDSFEASNGQEENKQNNTTALDLIENTSDSNPAFLPGDQSVDTQQASHMRPASLVPEDQSVETQQASHIRTVSSANNLQQTDVSIDSEDNSEADDGSKASMDTKQDTKPKIQQPNKDEHLQKTDQRSRETSSETEDQPTQPSVLNKFQSQLRDIKQIGLDDTPDGTDKDSLDESDNDKFEASQSNPTKGQQSPKKSRDSSESDSETEVKPQQAKPSPSASKPNEPQEKEEQGSDNNRDSNSDSDSDNDKDSKGSVADILSRFRKSTPVEDQSESSDEDDDKSVDSISKEVPKKVEEETPPDDPVSEEQNKIKDKEKEEEEDSTPDKVAPTESLVSERTVSKQQSNATEEESCAESSLPEGWEECMDEDTGQKYYFNDETEESTWDKPSKTKTNDDASQEGSYEFSLNKIPGSAETQPRSSSQESHKGSPNEARRKAEDSPEATEDPQKEETYSVSSDSSKSDKVEKARSEGLNEESNKSPPKKAAPLKEEDIEWIEGYDETYDAYYYFNEKTGESIWEKPNAPFIPFTGDDETDEGSRRDERSQDSQSLSIHESHTRSRYEDDYSRSRRDDYDDCQGSPQRRGHRRDTRYDDDDRYSHHSSQISGRRRSYSGRDRGGYNNDRYSDRGYDDNRSQRSSPHHRDDYYDDDDRYRSRQNSQYRNNYEEGSYYSERNSRQGSPRRYNNYYDR